MEEGGLFSNEGLRKAPAKGAVTALAHCDGGARGNPGPAGYGAVIVDEHGAKLAELSEYLGRRTNNYAEYSGLLGVLQWSLDHGIAHLRVVSDSELMVKQVQGRYKVNSPDLRPLFDEARRRIARLESFQIAHALRHKNKDADRLANEAMDRGTGSGTGGGVNPPRAERTGTASPPARAVPAGAGMLRGFVKDGVVHLLGGGTLPDGSFVKVIAE